MAAIELSVEGMSCGGCEQAVQNAVGRLPNVGSVGADHASGRVTVETTGDVDPDEIRRAITDAGYTVTA